MNYALDTLPRVVTNAVLCCECGVCESYACVMQISPVRMYQEVKARLRALGWKPQPFEIPEPRSYRDGRRIPLPRLTARLGLMEFDAPAEWSDDRVAVKQVAIPLLQHTGAPSELVVRKGDRVKRGDLIGRIPEGKLGACVHASISGTVAKVDECVEIVRD
jgi:Na+-translocating ferredoxin:NAD+ oxidoreductase RnfC subunit